MPSPSTPCQMSPKTTIIFYIIVPDWRSLWCLRLLHLASCLAGQRARGGVAALLVHLHTASSHQDPTAVSALSESITTAFSCNGKQEACEAAASCFDLFGNPCSQGNNPQWVMLQIPLKKGEKSKTAAALCYSIVKRKETPQNNNKQTKNKKTITKHTEPAWNIFLWSADKYVSNLTVEFYVQFIDWKNGSNYSNKTIYNTYLWHNTAQCLTFPNRVFKLTMCMDTYIYTNISLFLWLLFF